MSQEQSNRENNKNPRLGSRPPSGGGGEEPGQTPKKGPRFSIYWVYAIIFAVLIGVQVFNSVSSSMALTNERDFREMLLKNDVAKFDKVGNRKTVKIFLIHDSIKKYEDAIKKGKGRTKNAGPHFYF